MKKSIMLHICVAILRNNKKSAKPSVVIVCPGSMVMGRYLEAQVNFVEKAIQNIKDYGDYIIHEIVKIGQDRAYRHSLLKMSKEELYRALCYKEL